MEHFNSIKYITNDLPNSKGTNSYQLSFIPVSKQTDYPNSALVHFTTLKPGIFKYLFTHQYIMYIYSTLTIAVHYPVD